ncbi:hypothetical protein Jiend_52830 [Micromonospora endophytica]|nr:hypothetical protein Jiend_52830 [Micromonospora endophytica]
MGIACASPTRVSGAAQPSASKASEAAPVDQLIFAARITDPRRLDFEDLILRGSGELSST